MFCSDRAGDGFRIYVMDADGENVKDLSKNSNAGGFVYPAWSPDSKKIAYGGTVEKSIEIFVMDADGDNVKQLTKLGGQNSYSAWSPDGKQIIFQHCEAYGKAGPVLIMDADGKNQKEILKSEGYIEGGRAAWKPKD
jgi:TolB protein